MNRKVRLAIIIRTLSLPLPLVLVSYGLYSIWFFILLLRIITNLRIRWNYMKNNFSIENNIKVWFTDAYITFSFWFNFLFIKKFKAIINYYYYWERWWCTYILNNNRRLWRISFLHISWLEIDKKRLAWWCILIPMYSI
jgi:hypothetical protein